MKLLSNPVLVQSVALFVVIGAILFFGFMVARHLRKGLVTDATTTAPRAETLNFATSAYQSVIAGLKQREQDLAAQLIAEQKRSTSLVSMQQVVLDNIGSGVLVFNSNLLVQSANAAARKLLGLASPSNMHVTEVLRGLKAVDLPSNNGAVTGLIQVLRDVLARGVEYRNVPATYSTPAGDRRELVLAVLPMQSPGQPVTSVLCLIEVPGTAFTLSFPPLEAGKKNSEAE